MNKTTMPENPIICIDTKDKISIATAILSFLLLVSEILPYIKPKDKCNGLIHSLECLIKKLK